MDNPLLKACESCQAKTEQSLDNLLKINQELQTENDELRAKPAISPDIETFLDLITTDIEWQEAHLTSASSQEIITKIKAFRKIRPKKGGDNPVKASKSK